MGSRFNCLAASSSFLEGDDGHVRAADGVLFSHDGNRGRLIDDMMSGGGLSVRQSQVGN
jgi:hypothetical protein